MSRYNQGLNQKIAFYKTGIHLLPVGQAPGFGKTGSF